MTAKIVKKEWHEWYWYFYLITCLFCLQFFFGFDPFSDLFTSLCGLRHQGQIVDLQPEGKCNMIPLSSGFFLSPEIPMKVWCNKDLQFHLRKMESQTYAITQGKNLFRIVSWVCTETTSEEETDTGVAPRRRQVPHHLTSESSEDETALTASDASDSRAKELVQQAEVHQLWSQFWEIDVILSNWACLNQNTRIRDSDSWLWHGPPSKRVIPAMTHIWASKLFQHSPETGGVNYAVEQDEVKPAPQPASSNSFCFLLRTWGLIFNSRAGRISAKKVCRIIEARTACRSAFQFVLFESPCFGVSNMFQSHFCPIDTEIWVKWTNQLVVASQISSIRNSSKFLNIFLRTVLALVA